MEISILISILAWISWKNLNLSPQSEFPISKYRTRLAEKLEEEEEGDKEEYRQLQNVMRFTRLW